MLVLIYSFSAQTGKESGKLSYEISYEIVEIKDQILHTNFTPAELTRQAHSIHYYVRKAAHMTEYFLLAISVAFPLYVYGVRGFLLLFVTGAFCLAAAGLDEYHQSFIKGRGPSPKDVGIDGIGVLVGVILVQAFCWSATHNPAQEP